MTDDKTTPVAHAMAQFALDSAWPKLPGKVQAEAVRALINWVGCVMGGARTPLVDAAVRGVLQMEADGQTPLMGRPERVSLPNAALLACICSTAQTFDDTHLATITHPTGPVAAAFDDKWGKIVRDGKISAGN